MTEREDIERASTLGRLVLEHGWAIATAESCTGGLIGHLLTEVSGSSAFYLGGVIAYANEVKTGILRVDARDLQTYGAVSAPVARAMARSVRALVGTQIGISATGIAGPTGGTPDKPVGTVYLGLSSPLGDAVEHHIWPYERGMNKLASARRALDMVIEMLTQHRAGQP
ncbi:MAG: CinA family protein [Anaerolineae bacterium]